MTRSRGWCFTLQVIVPQLPIHEVEEVETKVMVGKQLESLGALFVVIGLETAPTTGQRHLQGYVYFKNARVRPNLEPLKPHWEPAKGSGPQNLEYCTKEDDDPFIFGECPKDSKKAGAAAWEDALASARAGDLASIPPKMYVSHYATWHKIMSLEGDKPVVQDGNLLNEWHWGPAGVGKSRAARLLYPEYYLKAKSKWWDGYRGEDTVIIDDWSPFTVGLTDVLKEWADRYPFQAEVKNGMQLIRPKRIVITSQYSIEQVWSDEETRAAMRRRFRVTHYDDIYGPVFPGASRLPGWSE